MEITKKIEDKKVVYEIEGRIDTITAPTVEAAFREDYQGKTEFVFDFAKVDYISSAGLRVLLMAHKEMQGNGEFYLTHVGQDIKDIFEMTGFNEILTIK